MTASRGRWSEDARWVKDAGWSENDLERDLIAEARRDRAAFAALYRRHYTAIAGYVHRRVGDVHATEDLVAEAFLAAMRSIGGYRSRGVPFRAWLYRIATNVVNRWAKARRRQLRRECSLTVLLSDAGAGVEDDGARGKTNAAERYPEPVSGRWLDDNGPMRGASRKTECGAGGGIGISGIEVSAGARVGVGCGIGVAGSAGRCGGAEQDGPTTRDSADAEIARRALLMLPPRQQAVVALHYLEGLPIEEVASIVGCRVGTVKSRLSRGREAMREMLERRR